MKLVQNTKLRAIAVDDESHCLKTLEFELERNCPEVELIQKIKDPEEAFEVLSQASIDLVFLDINLQSTSGIELLERLMPVDFAVIFVTAYDDYAIKAFDLSATHYLLKPVNGKRLRDAIDKVKEKKSSESSKNLTAMLEELKGDLKKVNKVAVPIQEGVEFLNPQDIIHIDADSNYSIFHLKGGKKLTVSKTLKNIEDLLDSEGFLRIHKSHLINIEELRRYVKNDGGYVILSNGSRLAVSRSRKAVLNELFK